MAIDDSTWQYITITIETLKQPSNYFKAYLVDFLFWLFGLVGPPVEEEGRENRLHRVEIL